MGGEGDVCRGNEEEDEEVKTAASLFLLLGDSSSTWADRSLTFEDLLVLVWMACGMGKR